MHDVHDTIVNANTMKSLSQEHNFSTSGSLLLATLKPIHCHFGSQPVAPFVGKSNSRAIYKLCHYSSGHRVGIARDCEP